MLVLTRKTGDQIVIDGNIIITVVDIWNGKVRLGIKAPRDKVVMRRELLDPPSNPSRGSDTPTE